MKIKLRNSQVLKFLIYFDSIKYGMLIGFMVIDSNALKRCRFFVTHVIHELKPCLLKHLIYMVPLDNIRHDSVEIPFRGRQERKKSVRTVLIALI